MNMFGFGIDLGTTTIDGCLVDISSREAFCHASRKNSQSLYGSDVINRILNATRDSEILKKMCRLALDDIILIYEEMLAKSEIKERLADKKPSKICISGNTTMISIILGYDISSLGVFPFETILKENVVVSSDKLFGGYSGFDCDVILTGCAGAFLGGDILAGLCFLDEKYPQSFSGKKKALLIDLGTNGEIVLNVCGKLYGTSTACGPAFEGCTKRQGVYGATMIDAIALAIKTRKLSKEGVLSDDFIEKGLMVNGVMLDMDIIRKILMAKSAIYSGIISLLRYAGIKADEIDCVYIAGGFGFHVDLENAFFIGLLPDEFKGKINVCGNTSLLGASLILCESGIAERVNELTRDKIKIIQLADDEAYKEMLINNMVF